MAPLKTEAPWPGIFWRTKLTQDALTEGIWTPLFPERARACVRSLL